MKNEYDVIVAGAGPAGSMAAYHAAKEGASVLLLEKDREVGVPVRCAEGVEEEGLSKLVDIKPEWVSARVKNVDIISPNHKKVAINLEKAVALVLDRKRFDADLAVMAAEVGALVRTRHNVKGLIIENDTVKGVKIETPAGPREIRASVVIAADGIESRVARQAGLVTVEKMKNMASTAQVTLSDSKIDGETMQFYLSSFWAPGGYLWIFPKGPGLANIGLGLVGNYDGDKKAIDFLNDFLKEFFPDGSILNLTAGGVPVTKTLKRITANGFMVVGDAARMVDPLTGGGIISGMQAGKLAGIRAAEAIKAGDVSEKFFQKYAKAWDKVGGKTHERLYKIKEAIYKFTDSDYNHIADKVLSIHEEKRTVFKIFSIALMRKPALLLDVARVFANY